MILFFRSLWLFLFLTTLPLALVGCGGGAKGPELGTVSGKVTYHNKPVPAAKMEFFQKDNKKNPIFVGTTSVDGSFSFAGIPPGSMMIAIKSEVPKIPQGGAQQDLSGIRNEEEGKKKMMEKMSPEDKARFAQLPQAKKIEMIAIPGKYSDPEKSGLSLEIKAGPQQKDFSLAD